MRHPVVVKISRKHPVLIVEERRQEVSGSMVRVTRSVVLPCLDAKIGGLRANRTAFYIVDNMPSFFLNGSVLIEMSLPNTKPADISICYCLSNPISGQDWNKEVQFTDHATILN